MVWRGLGAAGGIGVALVAAGCASDPQPSGVALHLQYPHASTTTLAQSPHEHRQTVAHVKFIDSRALMEDLDILFMTERPTRLTRWHDY
jgi:hypothetical protein